MKNLFLIFGILVAFLTFIACDDKLADESALPATARTFLQTHFPGVEVSLVEKDFDSYDVYLSNGFEVEFTKSGVWDEVKNHATGVPSSILTLIPEKINEYVAANYPGQLITGVNKERYGFDIDLNNGIEMEFNADGSFRRIDY
jgi:hypothetical protein